LNDPFLCMTDTHIFEERNNCHYPDDGGHAADYVLLTGYWTTGRPDTIERIQWRGSWCKYISVFVSNH
jgi:hypothetical protein